MTDIGLAKAYLIENQENFVLVKNGEIVSHSKDRGIKPVFHVFKTNRTSLEGASVADKITGEATARFLIAGRIKSLYSTVISESAYQLLIENAIVVEYGEKVPMILNRSGDDNCPMEKLSRTSKELEELIGKIDAFFKNI